MSDDNQTPGIEFIYAALLKNTGCFVEVGAHDGRSFSLTAQLADTGWKGLYIEAMPHLAERCRANHANNDVVVLNMAIGDGTSCRFMHDYSTDWFYSGDLYFAKAHGATEDMGLFPTVTLNSVLTAQGICEFDVLVVDVEGMEVAVLSGFDISRWMPKMVIIELHELDPGAEMPHRTVYVDAYMRIAGYTKIYRSDINTVYVRLESKE